MTGTLGNLPEQLAAFLPASLFQLQALLCLLPKCLPSIAASLEVQLAFCDLLANSRQPEFLSTLLLPSQSNPFPPTLCLSEWHLFHQYSEPESLGLSIVAPFPHSPHLINPELSIQSRPPLCPHCPWRIFLPPKLSCSISSDMECQSQPLVEEMDLSRSQTWQDGEMWGFHFSEEQLNP